MKKALYISGTIILLVISYFLFENYKFSKYIHKSTQQNNMNIPVNQKAPVVASSEIEIEASVDTVWAVLTNINNWPSWQKDVTKAVIKGDVKQGAEFHWKAGGLSFSSQIHTSDPKTKFGWTGKTIGASAIHNWFFEKKGNFTVVRVEESLQGVLPGLFATAFQKNLNSGVIKNLKELKAAAEHK